MHGGSLPVVGHLGGGSNVVVSHNSPVGHQKSGSGSGIEIIKFGRIWWGRRAQRLLSLPSVKRVNQHSDFTRACHAPQRGCPGFHVPVPDTFPYEGIEKKTRVSFPMGIYPQRSNKSLRIILLTNRKTKYNLRETLIVSAYCRSEVDKCSVLVRELACKGYSCMIILRKHFMYCGYYFLKN